MTDTNIRVGADLLHIYSQREYDRIHEALQCDESSWLIVKPSDVFEVYHHDPVVHNIIGCWMNGDLTWEQALMKCVVALSEQVQTLMKEKLVHWERSPMPPIHVTLHNKEKDSE